LSLSATCIILVVEAVSDPWRLFLASFIASPTVAGQNRDLVTPPQNNFVTCQLWMTPFVSAGYPYLLLEDDTLYVIRRHHVVAGLKKMRKGLVNNDKIEKFFDWFNSWILRREGGYNSQAAGEDSNPNFKK
jgi:hypothetical protein